MVLFLSLSVQPEALSPFHKEVAGGAWKGIKRCSNKRQEVPVFLQLSGAADGTDTARHILVGPRGFWHVPSNPRIRAVGG